MYAYAQSKVEICGVNTAKLQTLKNDEMRELLDRSHHGDKDARDKLICGNLRLVLSVIQRDVYKRQKEIPQVNLGPVHRCGKALRAHSGKRQDCGVHLRRQGFHADGKAFAGVAKIQRSAV